MAKFRFSRPGVDVLTANDDDISIHENYSLLLYLGKSYFKLTGPGTVNSVFNVPEGFTPWVVFYVNDLMNTVPVYELILPNSTDIYWYNYTFEPSTRRLQVTFEGADVEYVYLVFGLRVDETLLQSDEGLIRVTKPGSDALSSTIDGYAVFSNKPVVRILEETISGTHNQADYSFGFVILSTGHVRPASTIDKNKVTDYVGTSYGINKYLISNVTLI